MAKRRPWILLEKLASNQANALAHEVAALHREAQKIQTQRKNLSQALAHYALVPEDGLPISLLRNQLVFRDKIIYAITSLDREIEKSNREVTLAISRWQATKAKADAYAKLKLTDLSERLKTFDKAEGHLIEESAQQALFARIAESFNEKNEKRV